MSKGYDPVPEVETDATEHRRKIARALNRINTGKVNCTIASFTLTASATSTTLTDSRIYAGTYIDFMPTTANAAAAKTNIYITNQVKGSCTVNHASSANTDQTFVVVLLG